VLFCMDTRRPLGNMARRTGVRHRLLRCLPTSSPWRRRRDELQDMMLPPLCTSPCFIRYPRGAAKRALKEPRGNWRSQAEVLKNLPTRGAKIALFPLGNMQSFAPGGDQLATEGRCRLITPAHQALDAPLHVLRTRGEVVVTFEDHALMAATAAPCWNLRREAHTTPWCASAADVFANARASITAAQHGLTPRTR